MKQKNEWEEIGEIGVDAGLCWIGDPCYVLANDSSNRFKIPWHKFCELIKDHDSQQWNYKGGHPGLGVTVQTGYGDGSYPVYVKRNTDGNIAEVKVVFIPEDE